MAQFCEFSGLGTAIRKQMPVSLCQAVVDNTLIQSGEQAMQIDYDYLKGLMEAFAEAKHPGRRRT